MQTIVDFRQGQYGCHAPGVRGGNAFYATFFTATSLGYVSPCLFSGNKFVGTSKAIFLIFWFTRPATVFFP